jgi:hypothetical protein
LTVAEQENPDEPEPTHRHAHESSDVSIRAIALFGVALLFLGIAVHFMLVGLMNMFSAERSRPLGLARPLSDVLRQSSEPLLQAAPVQDLQSLRKAEDAVLNEYKWLNKNHGVLRIPIERAIDVVAERGLPSREKEGGAGESKGK